MFMPLTALGWLALQSIPSSTQTSAGSVDNSLHISSHLTTVHPQPAQGLLKTHTCLEWVLMISWLQLVSGKVCQIITT